MKKSIQLLVILVTLIVLTGLSTGCATVQGFGDDLDTLGRGLSQYQDTPQAFELDNSRK